MTPEATEPADFDQAIEAAMEAGIRQFVQRDGASLRREGDSELVGNSAVMLVQRMGATSVQEIDGLIAELQTLRALLQEEGERVQRKLAEYAHLCQSATQATKIIADSLKQWKPAQNDTTLAARSSLPALPHRILHRIEVHCRPFRTENSTGPVRGRESTKSTTGVAIGALGVIRSGRGESAAPPPRARGVGTSADDN